MTHDWYRFYPADTPHTIDISAWPSIADLLEKACVTYADNIALTCMGVDISYRQFDRLAGNFASYLQNEIGLTKGDRLAIMLPNILQFPIAFYAAQKIGVVCVNTNPLYTPREMSHQFKDSGAKAIIIVDLFAHNLEKCIDQTPIEHIIVTSVGDQLPLWKSALVKTVMKVKKLVPKHGLKATGFKDALAIGRKKPYLPAKLGHDDLALLQYTGGTTGISKGAMLTQANILSNMQQIRVWLITATTEGEEAVLTALPLYHIFALTVNFLTFLGMGQRMILIPKPIPISNLIKAFKKYPVSLMTGVNTLFNTMVNSEEFRANPPKHLKVIIGGGMAIQESVNKKWQQITGHQILEGFGLTESSPVTHCSPLEVGIRTNSCGVPLASTEAKIVDPDGKEVSHGETGELAVRGPQVMKGYWNRPEDTAATIKGGWLWTGDICKRDADGYFYIVDRKKDMILVSGFNVFPNEVEEVIASHPKVLEAAVVGVPDQKSGELVKAFVVPKDKSVTVEELKQYCADELTNYKRPRQIEFRDELPKTNVGKILRRELRDGSDQNKLKKEA